MKNRNKHKKKHANAENTTDTKSTKSDNNQNEQIGSQSKSRSRSRGRRSLSALFRRSAALDESKDVTDELVNESENVDVSVPDINPRTDPRGYLQRMTVREALVYNRKRGRSPNRRALKLEKKLINEDINLSKESLASSMPDLLDQITDYVDESKSRARPDVRGGSTLPRMKKRRTGLETILLENQDFKENSDNTLPLDKRKYLIKKDDEVETTIVDGAVSADKRSSENSHSITGSNLVSGKKDPIKSEVHRRDSYTQFVQLQDVNSDISVLPITSNFVQPPAAAKVLPNISISKSTTLESLIQPEMHSDVLMKSNRPKQVDLQNLDKLLHAVCKTDCEESKTDIIGDLKSTIDRQTSAETDRSARRSSYVSPRRFSRASRTSETSNKSSLSDASCQSTLLPSTDIIAQNVNLSEPIKAKYQRQFSRDSRTSFLNEQPKVMVNKETSTEGELAVCKLVNSATQTVDIKPEPKFVDEACQISEDLSKSEWEESSSNRSELEVPNDDIIPRSALKKEVVVVEQCTPVRRLDRQSVDSVFKPINVSIKQRKISEIAADNTIERIPDPIEPKDENVDRKSGKKKGKKSKEKRRKSTASSKPKEHKGELAERRGDPLNTGHKLRRSKSMSARPSDRHSRESHCIEIRRDDRGGSERVNRSRKRSRSVPRKTSKEKQEKSVANALRKAGRAASLSKVFDSMESVKKVDAEKDRLLKKSNISRSLSSINTETNEKFNESLKRLKSEQTKRRSEKPKQPKLSLAAVVALKSRIAAMKRAKMSNKNKDSKEETVRGDNEQSDIPNNEINNDNMDVSLDDDLSTAKVFYENEINTSIGKSLNSLEILDADKEVKDIVYEKRIQFSTPYCDDPMTEEELIKQRQRNTRLTTRRESKVRQRQKKVIGYCKTFIAFLFSHIGLCSLVVAYCILGGFIFKELEGPHEMAKKREITALRQNFTDMIHRLAFETTLTKGNSQVFKTEVNAILRNFSVIIHKQTKEAGWDGQEIRNDTKNSTGHAEPEQWSYPSSLLYAITVMTTIGK